MNTAWPSKNSRVNILAVDQEPADVRLLENYCRSILAGKLENFSSAESLPAAADRLNKARVDVVLLDPQLARHDGLDLLAGRNGWTFQTIIVSAHTELAMRAFDYGVTDFVPKPVDQGRLARALHRITNPPDHVKTPEPFIAVRRLGRIDLIPVDELLYVEGADKYSELVLANGQRSFHDKCLGRVETSLPPSFVRIHKSYVVRFAMIARLHVLKGSRYFAELRNGLRLPVGRSRYEQIKALLI